MKKLFLLSIFFSFVLLSCNDEPEPGPEDIRAYCSLYHFVSELGDVIWEVDDYPLPEAQNYAVQFSGSVILETASEEITFTVKHSGTKEVLVSQLLQLEKDTYYNVIVMGSRENPSLLFREIDTSHPQSGNVKFQLLNSLAGQNSMDLYMGGTAAENKAIEDISYLSLSTPFEVADYDARAAIVVTAHTEEFNQDSVLLSSLYNDMITSGASYLSVVAPNSFIPTDTLLTFWLYELPVE